MPMHTALFQRQQNVKNVKRNVGTTSYERLNDVVRVYCGFINSENGTHLDYSHNDFDWTPFRHRTSFKRFFNVDITFWSYNLNADTNSCA